MSDKAWNPEVERLRKAMMERFSDKLSMEEIAEFAYSLAVAPAPQPEINLNDYVWVVLTHDAEDAMRAYFRKLKLDPMKHTRPSENGWTRFQLHELMEMFGEYMYVGQSHQLFLNNVIRLAAATPQVTPRTATKENA